MHIKPYLSVKNALDALDLYKKIFNAEKIEHNPVDKTNAESMGMKPDDDFSRTTMHCSFKIGDVILYMSDNFTGVVLEKTNISLLIEPDTLKQGQEYMKNAEKAGCKITMPFNKQFWGDWFGSFTDEFGIEFSINFSPPKKE